MSGAVRRGAPARQPRASPEARSWGAGPCSPGLKAKALAHAPPGVCSRKTLSKASLTDAVRSSGQLLC